MGLVVMTDSEDYSPVMEAYRQRFRAAATQYLDPEWAAEVASWLRKAEPNELLTDRIARLIGDSDDLERIAESLKALPKRSTTQLAALCTYRLRTVSPMALHLADLA